MKTLRFAWFTFARDLRSGELSVLLAALVVAVAALTAVGFFTSRVSRGMTEQAGEVLAADLKLESGRPVDVSGSYAREAQRRGLRTGRTLYFGSVVYAGEQSHLASLRGVSDSYPLRGRLRISDLPFGPARETTDIPAPGEAWADARLLASLSLKVGDPVTIGSSVFRIAHVLDYRPDQGSGFADLAPTVLLRDSELAATGLVGPGSRATWSLLVSGEADAVAGYADWLKAHRGAGERLIDVAEASAQTGNAMTRAQRFLNLSALVTILLGAIAVAIATRRYAVRNLDTVALLKCLGAAQSFVLSVSVVELLVTALLASLVGTVLGYAAQALLAWLLRDMVAGHLPGPTFAPVWLGLGTALVMMAGYALPPLLELRNTPPGRVLSRNLVPARLRYGLGYVLAALALVAILFWLVRDAKLVAYVGGAVVVAGVVLYAAGVGLVRATGALRGNAGVAWRYGLANVARRGGESAVQVVAFGLGLTVLMLLLVVRGDLLAEWRKSLPPDVPNHFLINIQPGDTVALADYFRDHGVAPPRLYPWVRARLTDVNGVGTDRLTYVNERARAFAEREQNLSWSDTLPADNRLVSGQWWSGADGGGPEVSVASEYSDDLGIKVGDRLGFDVAGERIVARVANVRRVRWDGFRPNFFLLFRPGVLDAATGTYMTSVHLDDASRPMLAGLIRAFPSITVFDVEAILNQVRSVIDRAALAVEYVSLFTVLSGVIVLLATVQSTREERRYESATLRTLGESRGLVLGGVATEFVALGLLAGLLAAAASTVANYVLATRLFNLPYHPNPWLWAYGPLAGALLVGVSGVLAARSVMNTPPSLTLRAGA